MEYFVTVRTFEKSIDAHLFRIELENNGIEVYIVDEETVTIYPLYTQAIGGIKVKVHHTDVEKVRGILLAEEAHLNAENHCPRCGSNELWMNYKSMKNLKNLLLFIFSALLTSYSATDKYVQKCKKCGLEFND
jgi:hypothetical protein